MSCLTSKGPDHSPEPYTAQSALCSHSQLSSAVPFAQRCGRLRVLPLKATHTTCPGHSESRVGHTEPWRGPEREPACLSPPLSERGAEAFNDPPSSVQTCSQAGPGDVSESPSPCLGDTVPALPWECVSASPGPAGHRCLPKCLPHNGGPTS